MFKNAKAKMNFKDNLPIALIAPYQHYPNGNFHYFSLTFLGSISSFGDYRMGEYHEKKYFQYLEELKANNGEPIRSEEAIYNVLDVFKGYSNIEETVASIADSTNMWNQNFRGKNTAQISIMVLNAEERKILDSYDPVEKLAKIMRKKINLPYRNREALEMVRKDYSGIDFLKDGMTITIEKNNLKYTLIEVFSKNGESKIYSEHLPFVCDNLHDEKGFVSISRILEEGWIISEVQDYILTENSKKKLERSKKSYGVADIRNGMEAVASLRDYYQNRVDNGDPLFDQYMVDEFNMSKDIVEKMEKLLESLEKRN